MEKLKNAVTVSQRDKFEAELKKEIKKLQRHRESLKSWLQNSSVKEKHSLQTACKKIESLMEAFRLIERETKTKAFSKTGLNTASRDPREEEGE
jgi:CCR4-NOT transcription complex subunit 3